MVTQELGLPSKKTTRQKADAVLDIYGAARSLITMPSRSSHAWTNRQILHTRGRYLNYKPPRQG
jgi:hypothetical protein